MSELVGDLDLPPRLLLGSGPSNADPRVLAALATPLIGQFDPEFTRIMDDVMQLSRSVFRTQNQRSFPICGASRAGLEAVLASLIEHGDRVVAGVAGRFGQLLHEIALRYGADVMTVEVEWGRIIEPDAIAQAVRKQGAKLVTLVHADTSTGIVQPLEDIAQVCHGEGALLVVDAVLSIGGCEVSVDEWGLDACVGGLQKCLGGPPGMAPLTYNEPVENALKARRSPPSTNYLDLLQLQEYWSPARLNHHTAATSMVYALREALRVVLDEGLEQRWRRHWHVGQALVAGLESMGLELFGDASYRTPMITLVKVPNGVSEVGVRRHLLEDHNIEIMAAFGPLLGRVWRIGLMGYNARLENALTLLEALERVLPAHGFKVEPGCGPQAALNRYEELNAAEAFAPSRDTARATSAANP